MAEFAEMRTMDIWYARLSEEELMSVACAVESREAPKKARSKKQSGEEATKRGRRRSPRRRARATACRRSRSSAEFVDGRYRIVSQPPIIVPARETSAERTVCPPTRSQHAIHEQFRAYRATLQDDRRHLLERFEVIDVARKVVGVGSVGTRAFIVLLQGRDQQDPLFLQVKEATTSVLEDHLPKSRYRQPGERVVQGQRMMQAASDIFLGWTKGVEANRYLYWRQLRDMKGSAVVEAHEARRPRVLRAPAAVGRWRARTPDRATRSRSPRTSARGRVRPVDHRLLRALRRSERAGLQAFIEAIRSGRLTAIEGV